MSNSQKLSQAVAGGTNAVRLSVPQAWVAKQTFNSILDNAVSVTASTASTPLDLSTGSTFLVSIAANTTFSFVNVPTGGLTSITVITTNDATAGRAISFPTAKYTGGQTPPRSTAANAVDIWSFFSKDGGASWFGSLALQSAA